MDSLDSLDIKGKEASPASTTRWMSAAQAGLAGAVAGIGTDFIFYGLDSYKVMKQASGPVNLKRIFHGALPIATLGSGPSFGVFFAGYGVVRDALQERGLSDSTAVLVSSFLNGVPSSIVSIPADVMKKQLLLSSSDDSNAGKSVRSVARAVFRTHGLRGFFLGWQANLMKDIPFAAIKMSLYEGIARVYLRMVKFPGSNEEKHLNSDKLNKKDAAIVGFLSGAATAVLTNPLDCANTRIKSGEMSHLSLLQALKEIFNKDGATALYRGLAPRSVIIGFGSTVFWLLYAVVNDRN